MVGLYWEPMRTHLRADAARNLMGVRHRSIRGPGVQNPAANRTDSTAEGCHPIGRLEMSLRHGGDIRLGKVVTNAQDRLVAFCG